ncbi:DoxX family protein [Pseudomonas synxantha BG33R]|uniref:DoxX family protein n=1 Tax=Pseudomonas synxantha TaxID=47883 RepID=UPI00025FEEDC|nr:DoxX family protein [Pseudomonas synxantha]EIK68367.1 DoxX family protein [Pseudomonas synxantha BG33R]
MNIIMLAGRVLISLLFIWSGLGKLMNYGAAIDYINSAGLPFASLAYFIALGVELIVAPALLLGFKTKMAAAIIGAFSVVAAVLFHLHPDDANQITHFMKNLTISGGLLYVFAGGGGAYSLDSSLSRN